MHICRTCGKSFREEPYRAITDDGLYCSMECIPVEALDRPYSSEYFIRWNCIEFVEKKDGIETFDERVELENEMEEVIRQYRDLLWGDDEGNFYKREMFLLFDRMNRLHEEVHDILLHKEDQVYYAVMISWAEMFDEEKEYAQTILELIEDELKNGPVFYWNVGWDAKDEEQIGSYRDILCVENEADHVKMIDMIQSVSEKFQDPQTREIIDGILSYYISPCKVKKCRVCLYWEDVDNFSFDSEGNVFACHQSWNCL